MANTVQARKRARQNEKRRVHNRGYRSMYRTYIKQVRSSIEAGDQAKAREALAEAIPVLDRVASKGLVHKNKAARHKSRLSRQIEAMQG